ncbi:MAG: hypothetical protein ABWK01_02890 [Infirmifilum sp.]
MRQEYVFIFDLDGTLVPKEIAKELSDQAYSKAIEYLLNEGKNFPSSLRDPRKWVEAFSLLPELKEKFDKEYERILKSYEFKEESRRVRKIFEKIEKAFPVTKVYVLSANNFSSLIIEKMGLKNDVEVISVYNKCRYKNREDYYSSYIEAKVEEIEKIKKSFPEARIIYVGDLEEDRKIAELSSIDFIPIENLVHYLFEEKI